MATLLVTPAKAGKWQSGFCAGLSHPACPRFAENGAKAKKRIVWCRCDCHAVECDPQVSTEKGQELMAAKVDVIVTSDLSGEEGASTYYFGLDGEDYEIDLTAEEASELKGRLAVYVGHARKVKKRKKAPTTGPTPKVNPSKSIREWGRANGHDVPERGRLPKALVQAYEQSQKAS